MGEASFSVIFIILMIGLYPWHDTDFSCAKNQTKLRAEICPLDAYMITN